MDQFPLFRLPFVSYRDVLENLTAFELINLSRISSTTKKIVKSFLRTTNNSESWGISLSITSKPEIAINGDYDYWVYKFVTDPSTNGHFSSNPPMDELQIYSEDVLKGFQDQVEYVLNIFNCEYLTNDIDVDSFSNEKLKLIVDWMKSLQYSFRDLEIRGEKNNDELVSYIFSKLKVTDWLDVHLKESNGHFQFPYVWEHLGARYGSWVDLPRLLGISCLMIDLRNTNFTNLDMNQFVWSWMNNWSHWYLIDLKIHLKDMNMEDIVQNLEHVVIDEDVVRVYRMKHIQEEIWGGIDIRRIDGRQATLYNFHTARGDILFAMKTYWPHDVILSDVRS